MLTFYQRWAARLFCFKGLFLLCFIVTAAVFIWLLFGANNTQSDRWLLSSVVLALFWLLLWLWATVFYRLPAAVSAEQSLWLRLRLRLQLAVYYLLALVVTLLLFTIAYLGVRAITGIIVPLFFR